MPSNYDEVKRCDSDAYMKFFHNMLRSGVFFTPSQFETDFLSAAHTEEDIEKTIEACEKNMKKSKRE